MRRLQFVTMLCVFSALLVAADNPFLGTWKLNVAKSRGTPGTMNKEEIVTFAQDGNGIKRTVTGVDADGQKINLSATIPWDGMEHQVEGPNGPAMVAVKSVNDHTLNVTVKVNGKLVSTGRVVVSKDGKTMTSSFNAILLKTRKGGT